MAMVYTAGGRHTRDRRRCARRPPRAGLRDRVGSPGPRRSRGRRDPRRRGASRAGARFNYDVIEGKPTASRITAAANTMPMMAPRRMVLVRDLGADGGRRAGAARRVPRLAVADHRAGRAHHQARQAHEAVRGRVEEGLAARARGAAPGRAVDPRRGAGARRRSSTAARSSGSPTPSATICRGSRS